MTKDRYKMIIPLLILGLFALLMAVTAQAAYAQEDGEDDGSGPRQFPGPPSALSLSLVNRQISLSFTEALEADSYDLELRRSVEKYDTYQLHEEDIASDNPFGNQGTFSFGAQDQGYHYRVRARSCRDDYCSNWAWSNILEHPYLLGVTIAGIEETVEQGFSENFTVTVTGLTSSANATITLSGESSSATIPYRWNSSCSSTTFSYVRSGRTVITVTPTFYACLAGSGKVVAFATQSTVTGQPQGRATADVTVTAFDRPSVPSVTLSVVQNSAVTEEYLRMTLSPRPGDVDNVSYQVESSSSPTGGYSSVNLTSSGSTLPANTLDSLFFDLPTRGRYYRARASECRDVDLTSFDACSAVGSFPQPRLVPLVVDRPGLPTTQVTNTTATRRDTIQVSWSAVTGATHYRVEQREGSGGQWTPLSSNAQGTSYTKSGLTCGQNQTYYYRVTARGDGTERSVLWGTASPIRSQALTCPTAPYPDDLEAGGETITTIDLTWDRVVNSALYQVEYQVGSSVRQETSLDEEHTAENLEPDTTYQFRVRTRGDGHPYSTEWGDWSPYEPGTTQAALPEKPTNLVFSILFNEANQTEHMHLAYTIPSGTNLIAEFQFEERDDENDSWGPITPSQSRDAVGPKDSDRTQLWDIPNRPKQYHVRAKTCETENLQVTDRCSAWTSYSNSIFAAPIARRPGRPTTQVTDTTPTSRDTIQVSWPTVTGATLYRVEQREGTGGQWTTLTSSAAGTSFKKSGLTCGQNQVYYYRVSARGDGTDRSNLWGPESPVKNQDLTCPTAPYPMGLMTGNETTMSIDLTWNAVSNREEYQVAYQVGGVTRLETSGDEEHTAENLEPGTEYQFKVRTRGDGHPWSTAWGDWSPDVPGTTNAAPMIIITHLAPSIELDATDVFTISASNLRSGPVYTARVTSGDVNVAGLAGGCTSSQNTHSIANGMPATENLKGCGIGNTSITAELLENGTKVDEDPMAVEIIYPLPHTPTGLVQTGASSGQVTLEWNEAKYATGYQLQQKEAGTNFQVLDFGPYKATITTSGGKGQAVVTGLTDGTTYTYQVRSTNPRGHSGWSASRAATPQDTLETPTDLDIVPGPFRRAVLSWHAGSNHDEHTRYDVRVTGGSDPTEARIFPDIDGTELELNLDRLIPLGTPSKWQGLAEDTTYNYQVKAVDSRSSGGNVESGYSDAINLVDNPLLATGGKVHVPAGGTEVRLVWSVDTAATNYRIGYRALGDSSAAHGGRTHSDVDWAGESGWPYYSASAIRPAQTPGNEQVRGRSTEQVHAFRVMFEKGGEKYFSARDAYAWVSSEQFPGNDERVATYPFFGHHPSKVFRYAICESDFPTDHFDEWEDTIQRAMEEWQSATDGLIRTTRQITGGCLTAPLDSSPTYKFIHTDEDNNEIRMLDLDRHTKGVFAFPEYKSDVFKLCVTEADACVTSFTGYTGSRIHSPTARRVIARLIAKVVTEGLENLSPIEKVTLWLHLNNAKKGVLQASNEIESVDITFNAGNVAMKMGGQAPVTPDRIQFNACIEGVQVSGDNDEGFFAYTLTLHEIGHALGISGFDYQALEGTKDQPYEASHPAIPSSVMNYDDRTRNEWFRWGPDMSHERDCSPHPFDIMALYSLYQKVP